MADKLLSLATETLEPFVESPIVQLNPHGGPLVSGAAVPAAVTRAAVVAPPRVVRSSGIRTEILEGRGCLAGLRAAWSDLFNRSCAEPSMSYEWAASFVDHHVHDDRRVWVIVIRRADDVVGLVPLIARMAAGNAFCHLTPLTEEHHTHSDWLFAERTPETAEAFVEALHALPVEWDRFRMARVLETNSLTSLVLDALRRRETRYLLRPQSPSYFLGLPATYGAYLADRSAKFRNHLKRVERKVEACGADVTVLSEPHHVSRFEAAYDEVLEVERASWKEAHGTSITVARQQAGFFRRFGRDALLHGRLHLQLMKTGERAVAYNLGYLSGGQYSYLKTSFSNAARALGPATYLRARLVEDLIARGVTAVDFPGPPYEWERQWTDDLRWHTMLTVYSGSFRSRVLEMLERARNRDAERSGRTVEHVDPRCYPLPRPAGTASAWTPASPSPLASSPSTE